MEMIFSNHLNNGQIILIMNIHLQLLLNMQKHYGKAKVDINQDTIYPDICDEACPPIWSMI